MTAPFVASLVTAVAAVLLFDTLGALAAKRFGFPYVNLAVPGLLLYVLLGFFVQITLFELGRTLIVAVVAAGFEATAGWAIAARIGPGRFDASRGRIARAMAAGVVTNTAAALCGANWLVHGVAWALLRVRG